VTDLRAILAAVLLFEAAYQSGLLTNRATSLRDLAWAVVLGGITALGFAIFGTDPAYGGCFAALLLLNVIRHRTGMLDSRDGIVARWWFVPAAVVYALTRNVSTTAIVFGVLLLNRRVLRRLLHRTVVGRGPFALSAEDVEYIVPAPIEYRRPPKERGTMLLDVIVGTVVISAIAMTVFTAVASRAARIRQVREASAARECAVSELERLGAVAFADLAAQDRAEFAVPGGGEPGRVRVESVSDGLLRVRVLAPRRGAKPVVLETLRSRSAP
jgi:hypothetical protein